jgi:putative endonuclease
MKVYYTYILSSLGGTLYTGVTNDIWRRVLEHKHKLFPGFTSKYNVNRLVYYEESNSVSGAIYREKQIKGWTRAKKIRLIESRNPKWKDLAADWYEAP